MVCFAGDIHVLWVGRIVDGFLPGSTSALLRRLRLSFKGRLYIFVSRFLELESSRKLNAGRQAAADAAAFSRPVGVVLHGSLCTTTPICTCTSAVPIHRAARAYDYLLYDYVTRHTVPRTFA